jgi:hypothetical protein
VEPYDLQVRGTYVRAGLSLRRWLTSVACARERAWLSSDDLVPAAVYAIRRCLPRQEGPPAPAPEFFAGRRKP